jgi:hypothetical protein
LQHDALIVRRNELVTEQTRLTKLELEGEVADLLDERAVLWKQNQQQQVLLKSQQEMLRAVSPAKPTPSAKNSKDKCV